MQLARSRIHNLPPDRVSNEFLTTPLLVVAYVYVVCMENRVDNNYSCMYVAIYQYVSLLWWMFGCCQIICSNTLKADFVSMHAALLRTAGFCCCCSHYRK